MSRFWILCNQNYVSRFLGFLHISWAIFGSFWSRLENIIRETNFVIQQIQLTLIREVRLNGKMLVFVVVCILFSYHNLFPHDFKVFPFTLVNTCENIPKFNHWFLDCNRGQIELVIVTQLYIQWHLETLAKFLNRSSSSQFRQDLNKIQAVLPISHTFIVLLSMKKNVQKIWRPDLRSDKLGLSQKVYNHCYKNQISSHILY